MRWREWSFRVFIFYTFLLVVLPLSAGVSATATDSVTAVRIAAYEHRMAQRVERWNKLIPRMTMMQYAGGMGTLSFGAGWGYAHDHCLETHLLLGFIPKRYNRHFYWTLSARELWMPWRVHIGQSDFEVRPLTVSLGLNSILHQDFWNSQPDRYPKGYYSISTRLRFLLGVGQRFSYNIPQSRRYMGRRISFYYEISVCDLYLRQAILNSGIPFSDLFTVGVGFIHTF